MPAPHTSPHAARPSPASARLARSRELPDHEAIPASGYDRLVLQEINLYVRQLGLPTLVHPTAPVLLTILRHAEQNSGGYQRHLIGYAAANLDAATWVGQESEEGRLRLAAALDYLIRASDLSPTTTG